MNPRGTPAALALSLVAVAGACTWYSPGLMRAWVDPHMPRGGVKKILVIGVAENDTLRRAFEDTCTGLLRELEHEVVPGYAIVGDPKEVDKDEVAARLKKDGVTHVMVTRIVHRKDVENYTPTTWGGHGGYPGYYGAWYPYWSAGCAMAASPGYATAKTNLSVESNLYDIDSGKMVVTGLSKAYASDDPQGPVTYLKSLLYELRARRVL